MGPATGYIGVLILLGLWVLVTASSPLSKTTNPELKEGLNFTTSNKREVNFFELVTFPNDACKSSDSGVNGTCYLASECKDKGGYASGTCANGYGICCIIKLDCGGSSSENNTLLVKSSSATLPESKNPCIYNICPKNTDICRIKLDFRTFNIAGPQVGTTVAAGTSSTSTVRDAVGDCMTDTFTVSAPRASGPPTICGYNTGQHMILDATQFPDCHQIVFNLGSDSTNRVWDIVVTQHECSVDEDSVGPPGCLQYFTGISGVIKSYNFPEKISTTSTHLSNQAYTQCIRTELGYCGICYTPSITTPSISASFGVSLAGATTTAQAAVDNTFCATDYLTIPNGQSETNFAVNTHKIGSGRFCGKFLNTAASAASVSICTNEKPFEIGFVTDDSEILLGVKSKASKDEANIMPGGILGFSLNYVQQSC